MRTAALALAALLLAAPAGAEQSVSPDAPGLWGFAYEELAPGQAPADLVQRNAISCLVEPSLIAPAAEGYVLNSYRADLIALAAGQGRYLLQFENLCTYDAATALESCRRIADPADKTVYWTWYEPLDTAAGVYRAHLFSDEAELAAFKAKKTLPPVQFVTFPCPAEAQPRRALLQQAPRDLEDSEASYDRMLANFETCGYPLCGAEVQRLVELVLE